MPTGPLAWALCVAAPALVLFLELAWVLFLAVARAVCLAAPAPAVCLAAPARALGLVRALVGAAAFPVALALARPGRAGGVGMAVTVLVFNLHFSFAVRPAPHRSRRSSAPESDLSRRK